jgi:transposase InsO family protein
MSNIRRLSVGARVIYDGERWQVTAFDGSSAVLERAGAPSVHILVSALAAQPGFRFVEDSGPDLDSLGPTFDSMTPDEYRDLRETEGHLRELKTGYRSGSASRALPGEPRVEYVPSLPMKVRAEAKSLEVGVSARTLRRLAEKYAAEGLSGLVDSRAHRSSLPLGRTDARWVDLAREVLSEFVDASQPPVLHVIDKINARARAQYGTDVQLPSERTARRVLAEASRGQNAFSGSSAKQKRSIAGRPGAPYGRLRSDRLGQYILLDTTPLDVFAMDPVTLKWVGLQLTVAMDLCTRCITGLRLSPRSANSVDAALVLYETVRPGSRSHTSGGILPYGGVPDTVFVTYDPEASADEGLPGTAIETIVIDHGKMYTSEHVRAICDRLDISIQPAREYTATDKAPLERFFRTLREDLLAALPGYKGPDVYSRGRNVEDFAYYFSHELEAIIREWVVKRYHQRLHTGLCEPSVPGLELSPKEMWDLTAARTGSLNFPARPDMVYDFLPVAWRTIQHYGVEVNGLRYDGPGLESYRDATSPFPRKDGKWPIRFDPDDASRVFFQRPDDMTWVELQWIHLTEFPVTFSVDAFQYARRLAAAEGRHPDDRTTLAELLERCEAGLARNPRERKIALRRSEQDAAMLRKEKVVPETPDASPVEGAWEALSAKRLSWPAKPSETREGDDDVEEELSDEEFYASALPVEL